MYIIGISAFYHDSAVALLRDGEIIAATQEERFSRLKHDASFPSNALRYCLAEAGIDSSQIDVVVFYEKPFLKFLRITQTLLPQNLGSPGPTLKAIFRAFMKAASIEARIRRELGPKFKGKIKFQKHHHSHAASAFYPSPFNHAAILTIDGVGEYDTTTLGTGSCSQIEIKESIQYPNSVGLLYSAFTYYLGFKVNSGEYKVMGLAPYGEDRYSEKILERVVRLEANGRYTIDQSYFTFSRIEKGMTSNSLYDLLEVPKRQSESQLNQCHADLAKSLQVVVQKLVFNLAQRAKEISDSENLCLAGGVALNCVANGKLLRSGLFKNIWIQPASGDAGGALGAASQSTLRELRLFWYQ